MVPVPARSLAMNQAGIRFHRRRVQWPAFARYAAEAPLLPRGKHERARALAKALIFGAQVSRSTAGLSAAASVRNLWTIANSAGERSELTR